MGVAASCRSQVFDYGRLYLGHMYCRMLGQTSPSIEVVTETVIDNIPIRQELCILNILIVLMWLMLKVESWQEQEL